MAKKIKKREWYAATFERNDVGVSTKDVSKTRSLVAKTILFDTPDQAYAHRSSARLQPMKDEEGKHILNKDGIAQLPDYGKITVWGIKGKAIDWKRVSVGRKKDFDQLNSDVIQLNYELPLNKQTIHTVLEESDDMYNKFANSPLGKAGGLKPIPIKEAEEVSNETSTETVLS